VPKYKLNFTRKGSLFYLKIGFLFSLVNFFCFNLYSQSGSVVYKRCENLAKGVNLSNWLEAYWLNEDYPNIQYYSEKDIENISKMGFSSVRLPILFEQLFDTLPPYTVKNSKHITFELIDSVILWSSRYNLNLIIDNHHGYRLTDNNFKIQVKRLQSIWIYLAEKYQYLDVNTTFFELYNEPYGISNDNLHFVFSSIIDTMRSIGFNHTLIVGASNYNSYSSLIESKPYNDDNIIYTFHFYSPYNFTHQGLSWTSIPVGRKFPHHLHELSEILRSFNQLTSWSTKNNAPIMIGEIGVSFYAESDSRCNWINYVYNIINSRHLPWFYWDIRKSEDSFGFFYNDSLDTDYIINCFYSALFGDNNTNDNFNCIDPTINIYPNPSKGIVTIKSDSLLTGIEIYNIAGKVVVNSAFLDNELQINLSHLAKGSYIIKVRDMYNEYSYKWVKY
jgi:endoglucanase